MDNKIKEIGWLSKNIIDKLNITDISINTPIYLGSSNINHMLNSHPADYNKYKNNISEIINTPDYGYLNSSDNSIELIKDYINSKNLSFLTNCNLLLYVLSKYFLIIDKLYIL